ncbi:hypothetical protein WOLCODRAFT_156935 [Wolfiporia cocos MD-104 SS10]|uniref:Uncharacterized protein n=1 Tax=Wolfiporia cocos (strain MD-104) TaxID=742152 RepID=A0A2H3J2L5_WOLCO|nr:hypothetical protein WOLCODRAFT_156935 [Wolfiporia cocos MD-104 SS10]
MHFGCAGRRRQSLRRVGRIATASDPAHPTPSRPPSTVRQQLHSSSIKLCALTYRAVPEARSRPARVTRVSVQKRTRRLADTEFPIHNLRAHEQIRRLYFECTSRAIRNHHSATRPATESLRDSRHDCGYRAINRHPSATAHCYPTRFPPRYVRSEPSALCFAQCGTRGRFVHGTDPDQP